MKHCKGPRHHCKGCHPGRPRCHWNRKRNPKWEVCNCGYPNFPHRKGTLCGKFACVSHPMHAQKMFEAVSGQKWDGET